MKEPLIASRRRWIRIYVLLGLAALVSFFSNSHLVSVITLLAIVAGILQSRVLFKEVDEFAREREQSFQELRKSQEALRESEERFRKACDFAAIGMALVSVDGRWLKVNQALCSIVGYSEQELLATDFQSITDPEDLNTDLDYVKKMLNGEIPTYQMEKRYLHKDGHKVWIQLNVSLVRNDAAKPLYFISQIQDITHRTRIEAELRASLAEKDVLLKEIHHRVKNNMQIIVSLLNLQSTELKDPGSIRLYNETQDRVKSMALIHEKLYQSAELDEIDFHAYIDMLLEQLARSYGVERERIRLEPAADSIHLNLDVAVPCGLILNELVSNALKYAFPAGRTGTVRVALTERDGQTKLSVSDDGVGLPQEFKLEKTPSLGLRLVSILAGQIIGKLTYRSEPGCTQFEVEFSSTHTAQLIEAKGLHA